MATHVLYTIDEYARNVQALHPAQSAVVVANIEAGNAVSLCSCGHMILALERKQVITRYLAHTKAVQEQNN